jgi:hypothetical protein
MVFLAAGGKEQDSIFHLGENSTSEERILKAENLNVKINTEKAKNLHILDVFEHFFRAF